MVYITNYLNALITLTTEMAPYLLFGFLISGLLKVALPPGMLTRYMGKSNLQSVTNASLLGIPLPLCSCGVLPAGISLYKNGASKGASVSFLISTPQTGIDSLLVTYSMLGLPFALIRPVAAMFSGVLGGLLTNRAEKSKPKVNPTPLSEPAAKQKFSVKALLQYSFVEMVNDLAKWLVIGLLLAALITVLIPDDFFKEYALSGFAGMLLILAVSIPLYVCATASVPIAAVLLLKGLSPGAMLVFLMAGPATNAATMTVIGQSLGRKTLAIYVGTLVFGALLFGLIIDYALPASWFNVILSHSATHEHEILPNWLSVGSAIIMTLLIAYSYLTKWLPRFKNTKKTMNTPQTNFIKFSVEGMTCNHCKASVENALNKQEQVVSATADIQNNTVTVYGNQLDIKEIEKTITQLNYIFKGEIK